MLLLTVRALCQSAFRLTQGDGAMAHHHLVVRLKLTRFQQIELTRLFALCKI